MLNLRDRLQDMGFVLLEGYQPEISAADIVSFFGEADTLGQQGPVHQLKPKSVESAPLNTYSGNYGLGNFPLHTDLAQWHVPPRFLMLRCLHGSAAVPTILADSRPIIEKIGETTLTRALIKPRRLVQGKRLLLRLLERHHGDGLLFRWDEKYILPASPAGERGMSQLRTTLASARRQNIYLTHAGDTLILDNWRMLHGRGCVPPDALNRTIARAYLRSIH